MIILCVSLYKILVTPSMCCLLLGCNLNPGLIAVHLVQGVQLCPSIYKQTDASSLRTSLLGLITITCEQQFLNPLIRPKQSSPQSGLTSWKTYFIPTIFLCVFLSFFFLQKISHPIWTICMWLRVNFKFILFLSTWKS